MDLLGNREQLDLKVLLERLALKEKLALKGLLEQLDLLVQKDLLVRLEVQVRLVHLDLLESIAGIIMPMEQMMLMKIGMVMVFLML